MMRRPPRSTLSSSSAASDVYKRQVPLIINTGIGTDELHESKTVFIMHPTTGATALNKSGFLQASIIHISPPLDIPVANVSFGLKPHSDCRCFVRIVKNLTSSTFSFLWNE